MKKLFDFSEDNFRTSAKPSLSNSCQILWPVAGPMKISETAINTETNLLLLKSTGEQRSKGSSQVLYFKVHKAKWK